MNTENHTDVIIIGGSYSGLSAAMTLGRSLRNVLIIDAKQPCNRDTPHSQNFITHDGEQPHIIAHKARAQVLKYDTVRLVNDFATQAIKTNTGFKVSTQSGLYYNTKKIIIATGIKDILPDIKGFKETWAKSVIHCPYCHGYEFINKKTAIYSNGDKAFHINQLVHNLSKELSIITKGPAHFSEAQTAKLKENNIPVIEKEITEIIHDNGEVKQVIYNDGSTAQFDAIYVQLPFEQHTNIPQDLGCDITENGYIKVDDLQKTTTPGVYACGDNVNKFRSVANAVYTGNIAGAALNMELAQETF
ncbi:NAD(P)/FAD-dependent oxidoreductase [Winogradskyella eckloniae]|uniref:NAD(P)/FAD-dependent oxidoreductase n=1 Tax=Winogradskyella eckloniae TaxID=1089306 RepID=UPI00156633A7|nr:NAD(P)/FAD-dependent oxidoreductase [Winogradskyella eckloniae]NRD21204.1 NAD(P)/FAD-dependent oxidoreductase [Winogradskyella eckloniae]